MSILDKRYIVTMPDKSRYEVPVRVIAQDHAEQYASEFDGDVERSLQEGTLPLFEDNYGEIADWAKNNMDWEDVKLEAKQVLPQERTDFQEGWVNGEWEVADKETW